MKTLTDKQRLDIVENRMENAHSTLAEVESHREHGFYNTAVKRMYYACYYMTSALLISRGLSANTHAGVIRMLGMHFVSKGLLSNEMGYFYSRLFEMRQAGDYDDWTTIGEQDIIPLSELVEPYLQTILHLIRFKNYSDKCNL